jgi:hypothetical protein
MDGPVEMLVLLLDITSNGRFDPVQVVMVEVVVWLNVVACWGYLRKCPRETKLGLK